MPELPEVETIRRDLETRILNKKISKIWIEKSFQKKISPEVGKFSNLLRNQTLKEISRRSKLLIFRVKDNLYLLIHLKMTGQLVYRPAKGRIVSGGHPIETLKSLPNKFTRATFYFADKSVLYFNDLRKFGYLKLVDKQEMQKAVEKIGIEPISRKFTYEYFVEVLKKRKNKKIKQLLLEQDLIAGLGNIYADEVCFMAQVKPMRRVNTLTSKEKKQIFAATKKVLQKAIKYRGTSFNTYVGGSGEKGGFEKHLKVYGRLGQQCLRCKKGIIEKTKIGSRSSAYCPVCQK